ncbi:sigma-70 family RNA polymerase sigma factor [Paraliomyxa miuraensis]|uniref:sigma-70 family RNA polymerase sigma factor n=1 Tax=Paraliomyxa miuraensis TaxID=376150 RepID=UPI0022570319|nr:sigma-70 family RNA polymerase sigma factor [Paraliomyxa miuraensis]MCX4240132.1 sigma-70 family RNA polymerase sigma factor [Paraliomyxa miuraensis]
MGTGPGEHTLEALIDELARVLHDAGEARELVLRAGFPVGDLPEFDTAVVFWSRVVRAADVGKTVGGVGAIVELAKTKFPGNEFFAARGSMTSKSVSASTPMVPRGAPPIDNHRANIGQQIIVRGNATFGAMTVNIPRSGGSSQASTIPTSDDPDLELLSKWRGGDRRAGERLIERYFGGVRRYFLLKFPDVHEDLVQETFSRVVEARDVFRGESTFKTYLFRIARYVGAEYFRQRYRQGTDVAPVEDTLVDFRIPLLSSVLIGREDHRLLLDALQSLSLEQQEVIVLYYWEGLTVKQISESMEQSEATIRGRLRSAKRHLAQLHRELGQQEHSREATEGDVEHWLHALRQELRVAPERVERSPKPIDVARVDDASDQRNAIRLGQVAADGTRHRLSILHISDLHARSTNVDGLPEGIREQRRGQVQREAVSRARVLGDAWDENLRELYPRGERPDLVCLTGDVADWGLAAEYDKASEFVERLVRTLGITKRQIYVVPGNHDVDRSVNVDAWQCLRELAPQEAQAISDWLARGRPPRAVDDHLATAVLERTAAFWQWVEHGLGRPELLPSRSHHGRLGYHHLASVPSVPFDVHVIGLDSAWLSGDDNDQGKLWLTAHQRDMLLHDTEARPWPGFRLVLVHHPLEELASSDAGAARMRLAERADLLLHGHQHDPVGSSSIDLDGRTLRLLAAGCLFEGNEGSEWKNGCHRIDVMLDEGGRPISAEIRFRAWSRRGHWHADSSIYRQATNGTMVWSAWSGESRQSRAVRPRTPSSEAASTTGTITAPSEAPIGGPSKVEPDVIREPTVPVETPGSHGELTLGAVQGLRSPAELTSRPDVVGEKATVAANAVPTPVPAEPKEWNAESAVRRVLGRGPTTLVQAFDDVLGSTRSTIESPVARVAAAIVALGLGPAATLELVKACYDALSVVEEEHAECLGRSTDTVRALLCEWLPRRLPDGTQVTLRHRAAPVADGCPDMTAATLNAILVDAYVGHADDMPLSVASKVDKDEGGRNIHTIVGTRRLPVPPALGAEMSTVEDASDELADAIASQFPGQYDDDSRDGRRRFAQRRLAFLRRPGLRRAPRYMALKTGAIPEDVLVALKGVYPALRFVSLSGADGDVEQEIVQYLIGIFSDDDGAEGS